MKQRLLSFVVALMMALAFAPAASDAQTITLRPNAIPNGIAAVSGERYHQRFDIALGGTAQRAVRGFTITLPPEVTLVAGSVTATAGVAYATFWPQLYGQPAVNQLAFGWSSSASSRTITVEFDVTTPPSFTGLSNGGKRDTSYAFNFSSGVGSARTVAVAKHQNRRVKAVAFSAPDSSVGDTTTAGGRFYKLQFPTALPDLSHRHVSGLYNPLTAANDLADAQTDIQYSFYLSTDSALVQRPLSLPPAQFFTMLSDPSVAASSAPLAGTRQNPRVVPATFIREDFTTTWSGASADSVAGVISLEGTADNAVYYVYALADPGQDRNPGNYGSQKKPYDPTTLGAFTGGVFLGRSGPLLVRHPPEFVIAGWDYDTDGGDDFDNTGVVQVASDINGMTVVAGNLKDNVNLTVDSGAFAQKGAAIPSFFSGNIPEPVDNADLLFIAQDADNPNDFRMNIILSTNSGLTVADLSGTGIDSFDVASSVRLNGTDTLSIDNNVLSFKPFTTNSVTGLVDSFVPEGTYNVYFVATDGTYRTVYQVQNDPFQSTANFATLTVRHSPNISGLDAFAVNDFDGSGDGDLDVITGIDVSQMQTDVDGKNLSSGPAQRFVNIFWGGTNGLDGDIDIDDNASIDLYFSTASSWRTVGGSVAYTSGNSDGSDLLAEISNPAFGFDVHRIASGISEDADGKYDDSYQWDIWNYVSPEGTIPRTGVRYYLYAIMNGGSTRRLVSFTQNGAINFQHPPYARVIEPSQDVTVTVDDPLTITWEAIDVDNEEAGGLTAKPAGTTGRIAGNGRNSSPNIRILLSSADFGEVTTWASISNANEVNRFWVGNSTDGSLGSEVELNEGVDTSFVIVGNRMRNNLGAGASSASLELQTNGGLGETYFVYLSVDRGGDGTVADQQTNFDGRSPLVRAPGRITFTGTVPASPPTSPRFFIPTATTVAAQELVKYPITPDEGDNSGATSIEIVNIFLTVDADKWEAVDTDAGTAGIQPFSLGANSTISAANVSQLAYVDPTDATKLRLDFIYDVGPTGVGLSFFDGTQELAVANLRAKNLSAGTVSTTISLDNSGSRKSVMINGTSSIGALVPPPTTVDIVRRSQITGTVPLQSRATSADQVTFFLREVGDFLGITDSLFNTQDEDAAVAGVQVTTSGVNGDFTLTNVPSGRFVLVASVPGYLSGHDTVNVAPGLDISGLQPTLDGAGVDRAELLAGDAAGYRDSTGASIPDNVIDGQDISAVNAALFTVLGDPDFNAFADFNRDSIITGADKNFATVNRTNNTGTSGIKPVFPTFKQAVISGDNASAQLTLTGLPEGEVRAGEAFDVTVAIAGAAAVRTYEFHLAFDPTKVEVEDVVSQGTLFSNYAADLGGKVKEGEIGLVNSILGQTPTGASGEGTLATIRFRAIGRASEAPLAITDALLIDVEHGQATPVLAGEAVVVLSSAALVYHDADGVEIRGLIVADADPVVDFNDFMVLAQAFGSSDGAAGYDFRADLNGDASVDFADFVLFTQDFGRVAVDAPTARRVSKVLVGANGSTEMSLKMEGSARMGEDLVLTADVANASELSGWGLTVSYDATKYEFVEASAPEGDLLAQAGDTPLFLVHETVPGELSLASGVSAGQSATGEGSVARLVFRPKGDFEGAQFPEPEAPSRFAIAEGIVFDASALSNPAIVGDALEVRAVPTAFALAQNFPNPFNPETTVSYDIAESGRVQLDVYNVMGQLVRTLVSDDQAPGRYRVVWSGDDATGRQVASGVYFYRLQAGSFKAVRKLMLLK